MGILTSINPKKDVFTNFKDSILKLESLGCEIKEIQVHNIPETNTGHLIAISGEGAESAREFIHTGRNLSPENFTILNAALSSLTAADYLLSAKLRTKVMADLGWVILAKFCRNLIR